MGMKVRRIYIFLVLIVLTSLRSFGQSCVATNPGQWKGQDVVGGSACAPNNFTWNVWYGYVNDGGDPNTVQIQIDWGDGTIETFDYSAGEVTVRDASINEYEVVATHTYDDNNSECAYIATANLSFTSTGVCVSSEREQETTVLVWNTDDLNGGELNIGETVTGDTTYEICPDTDHDITFTDFSVWNCTPPQELEAPLGNANNLGRWVQFVYGSNNTDADFMGGVEVDGAVRTYPYSGDVFYYTPTVIAPGAPYDQTLDIHIPASAATVGSVFEITLKEWNVCNPYDADLLDGDALNPAVAGGDSNPIETEGYIVVVDPPNPDIDITTGPGPYCVGDAITFDAIDLSGTGGNLQYLWDFGDGDTSTSRNPTHTYTNPSTDPVLGYLVSLTITNTSISGGCTSPTSAIASVFVEDGPVADFTMDQSEGCGGNLDVLLTNTSTGSPDTYDWRFIDVDGAGGAPADVIGSTDASAFTVSFTAVGHYQVELTSTDSGGGACPTNTTTQDVYLYDIPTADFSAGNVCVGSPSMFTDLSGLGTAVDGDLINNWEWDFDGNGTIDLQYDVSNIPASIENIYSIANSYDVTLTVTTDKGVCTSSITQTIDVLSVPEVTFSALDPTSGCSDLTVTFESVTTATGVTISKYLWKILDTETGTETVIEQLSTDADFPEFTHIFSNNKTDNTDHLYEVSLDVESDNGCGLSLPLTSETITVNPGPVLGFTHPPLTDNCTDFDLTFTTDANTQSLDIATYDWVVEDENGVAIASQSNTSPDFTHTFQNGDTRILTFDVILNVTLNSGNTTCLTTARESIDVDPLPVSGFTVTLIDSDCGFETYHIVADELSSDPTNFNWTFSLPPYNTGQEQFDNDFQVVFERPLSGSGSFGVDISLSTTNFTGCASADTHNESITITEQPSTNLVVDISNGGGDNGCAPFMGIFETLTDLSTTTNTFELVVRKDGALVDPAIVASSFSGDINGSFSYNFNEPGLYLLNLQGTEASGTCVYLANQAIEITVHPEVTADFELEIYETCANVPVIITDLSTDPAEIASTQWTITDLSNGQVLPGFPLTGALPIHTFENATSADKDFEITLEITSLNNCTSSASKTITIKPGVVADLSVDPAGDVCGDTEVTFTNSMVSPDVTYTWSWGDGTPVEVTTTETSVSHVFNNTSAIPVNFTVRLIAENNNSGCRAEDTYQLTVNPTVLPIVDVEENEGCAPFNVQFTNFSYGAEQQSWGWRIKDSGNAFDEFSLEERPSREFSNTSADDITIEVEYIGWNSAGCVQQDTIEILVHPEIRASFTAGPIRQTFPNTTVTFTNQTNLTFANFAWNFGDGNNISGAGNGPVNITHSDGAITSGTYTNPIHTYAHSGEFNVILTSEANGCANNAELQIIIDPDVPVADFTYDVISGCRPLEVQFTSQSEFAESYVWDFGDNNGTSTQKNPRYTYYNPGKYTVTLRVYNAIGEEAVETKEYIIEVLDRAEAYFNVRPNVVNVPGTPMYTANLSINAISYFWDFGDGNTSTEFEPVHTYTEIGTFDITLIAINENGCSDTLKVESIVRAEEGGEIRIPNVFTPNLDGPTGGHVGMSGYNDVFIPKTDGVIDFYMEIYNRWGELIFVSQDVNIGWDGYYKGRLAKQDVYVYKVKMTFRDGETTTKVGDVTLLR